MRMVLMWLVAQRGALVAAVAAAPPGPGRAGRSERPL